MGNEMQYPYTKTLVASGARIASGGSGAIEIPVDLTDILLILKSTAGSGTTTTLDVAVENTPDDGTTWVPALKFTQIVVASPVITLVKAFKSSRTAEAGVEITAARTGAAVSGNTILTRKIQIYWTIAGTNPSFTFTVFLIGKGSAGRQAP
jgi:hypothetical protein